MEESAGGRGIHANSFHPSHRESALPAQSSDRGTPASSKWLSGSRTRVELEHRNLERHGEGWEAEREGVAGDGGWPLYLQRFAEVVKG
jgi:hypothetical protein